MGLAELGSDREYSRPTFATEGFWANIISMMKSVFKASLVPVTQSIPVSLAVSGSETAA